MPGGHHCVCCMQLHSSSELGVRVPRHPALTTLRSLSHSESSPSEVGMPRWWGVETGWGGEV